MSWGASVFSQSYRDWEIIIGINGHEENSEVYKNTKRFEGDKIKILDLYTIHNKADALNKMLEYTTYEWIALLDVDDIWKSDKLEKQIPFTNDYQIVGTKCKYFGDKGNIPKIPVGNLKNFNFKEYNPIINSSCFEKNIIDFIMYPKFLFYIEFTIKVILILHIKTIYLFIMRRPKK